MLRRIIYGETPPPRWTGYAAIGALIALDLIYGLPLLATNGILLVLLGGFYHGRNLQTLAVIGVLGLGVDCLLQWNATDTVPWWRLLVALICFWLWNRLRERGDVAATAAMPSNVPGRNDALIAVSNSHAEGDEDSDQMTSSVYDHHSTGFAKLNIGDTSNFPNNGEVGPVTGRPHRTSILLRLIDTGVFSRNECEVIASILEDAPDLETGLKRCVLYGKLTGFQADCIAENAERRLRVGHYTLLSELGRGGMGTVYRAFDRERNENVALKLFLNLGRHLLFIRREMSVLQELAHPNLITAYEVGDSDGYHYIAMELLKGDNLFRIVKRDGPFEEAQALEAVHQVARAMMHMHERGVVHRDIKPSNVMKLDSGRFKLMDVGICRPSGALCEFDSFDLGDSSTYGTIGYAAPEQLDREGKVDYRSDYYSLGSLLFFLLTGECYLEGGSLRERLHTLLVERRHRNLNDFAFSPWVTKLLEHLLQYEPDDRPQSDAEVLEMLRQILNDHPQQQDDCRIVVLVVEDDPTDLAVTQRVLKRTNHSVDLMHAPTFARALQVLANHPPRERCPMVVLLDLQLPDSPVGETLNSLPLLSGDYVGVIAVSGNESPEIRQRCIRAGAMEFVSKNAMDSRLLERAIFSTASRLQADQPPAKPQMESFT